ncbi:hypothetical protein TNCV_2677431 [Trichonephila clavipes]|nr:hypothetical protein TNCV_2677431 [Trichonephila clavipes]
MIGRYETAIAEHNKTKWLIGGMWSPLLDKHRDYVPELTSPTPLGGSQHLEKIRSSSYPVKVHPPQLYRDEVWRSNWPIPSANILTFQKFTDQMSLTLSFIKIKSRPTASAKRRT